MGLQNNFSIEKLLERSFFVLVEIALVKLLILVIKAIQNIIFKYQI